MADLSSLNLVKGKKRFKILSIDGGGIKGLYSAEVLAKFEEIYQCRISDHFDLICGTSTGGIIALGISLGIPMSDICKFYTQHGPRIFCADKQRNKNNVELHIHGFNKSRYPHKTPLPLLSWETIFRGRNTKATNWSN